MDIRMARIEEKQGMFSVCNWEYVSSFSKASQCDNI